ncbi:MAG: hypothetical protein DRP87_14065 [Spirochaetes bacterium]|nr:MAG: hypothetical protein DRP87_14065 [Spirochaetota bacterium]
MKIKTKLFIIMSMVILVCLFSVGSLIWIMAEIDRFNHTILTAKDIVSEFWKLLDKTHQILVSGQLEKAVNDWEEAVTNFEISMKSFMESDVYIRLLSREDVREKVGELESALEILFRKVTDIRNGYERIPEGEIRPGSSAFEELYIRNNKSIIFLVIPVKSFRSYIFEKFEEIITGLVVALQEEIDRREKLIRIAFIGVVGIAGILTVIFTVFIVSSMRRKLEELEKTLEEMATGDFTKQITVMGKDEISNVGKYMNGFIKNFSSIINEVKKIAEQTVKAREEVTSSTSESSASLTEIVSHIESITRQITELDRNIENSTGGIRETTRNIESLTEQIENQSSAVTQSSNAIEEMSTSINNVARISSEKQRTTTRLVDVTRSGGERVAETDSMVSGISKAATEMLEIVTIINDIANQTSMLSMNAAIEAAHAGEAGRGFSVVAEEIRKLSDSTNENAKRIENLLKNVTERAERALELSSESRLIFESIDQEVKGFTDALSEIVSAMQELSQGSNEVLKATVELSEITQGIRRNSETITRKTQDIGKTMHNIRDISLQVMNGMKEIDAGAKEINEAMVHVNEINQQSEESIFKLHNAVDRFKIG